MLPPHATAALHALATTMQAQATTAQAARQHRRAGPCKRQPCPLCAARKAQASAHAYGRGA